MSKEIKKLTEEELEDLVYEIIRFCKDWNLWDGVKIYAAGKSYMPFYEWEIKLQYDKKGFRDLDDVCICFQDDPEDDILSESAFRAYGLSAPIDPDKRRRFVNPELLSMVYDGGLYCLLNDIGYSENLSDLPAASQKEVRENDEGYMDEVEFLREEDAEDLFGKYEERMLGSYHPSADFVLEKFDAIFDKYGIWYDFGFSWSLTTFYKSC